MIDFLSIMSNLDKLIFAWRLSRALVFSNPPEESLNDLKIAYDSLTNVLLDCLECDDIRLCDVKPLSNSK